MIVREVDDAACADAYKRIEASLDRAVARGKLDASAAESVRERIEVDQDPERLADRQLVIEAIVEDEVAKLAVLEQLDGLLDDPDAILASNTSSIRS